MTTLGQDTGKETIYVDIDDEITTIIDKVQSSKQKIIALVLPKRSTTLQSIVNMRLLKHSAESADKKLVLITSEASLLPLAGAVNLYVAKNLTSKPEIPPAPRKEEAVSEVADSTTEPASENIDKSKSVGELAGDAPEDTETIELEDEGEEPGNDVAKKLASTPAMKKLKKIKIPNFDRFRLGLALIVLTIIGLITFFILAITVLPKATVNIRTNSSTVSASVTATTSGEATSLDEEKAIIPAQVKELKNTLSEKAAATGSKDLGNKASGKVVFYNCSTSDKLGDVTRTVPAGTAVSAGSLTFITQTSVDVLPSGFTGGTNCKLDKPSTEVEVVAQGPGEKYNISPTTYAVAGFSTFSAKDNSSGGMTGGTSNVVKVISDDDVNNAKQKLSAKVASDLPPDFYKQLEADGLFALHETATSSEPKITTSPNVGDQASEVTVTEEITYSVLAVSHNDLNQLLRTALNKQIDTKKQKLSFADLVDQATVRFADKKSVTDGTLTIEKSTTAVPILNTEDIKKEIVGKKAGDIKKTISNRPGVIDVSTSFSPFWVDSVPKNLKQIKIIIQTQDSKSAGN